jgi:hypothetical protein
VVEVLEAADHSLDKNGVPIVLQGKN